MTDEERAEAERLADDRYDKNSYTYQREGWFNMVHAYVAACEAKRAEIEELRTENEKHRWRLAGAQVDITLEAERARFAEVITRLYGLLATLGKMSETGLELSKIIAEYDAKRD